MQYNAVQYITVQIVQCSAKHYSAVYMAAAVSGPGPAHKLVMSISGVVAKGGEGRGEEGRGADMICDL